MDPTTITTAVTAVGSAAGGGAMSAWLLRLLIKRWIKENDNKHNLAASGIKSVAKALKESNDKMSETLTAVKMQLASMQTTLGQVVALKEQIQADHDKLIEVATWNTKYKEDLVAQWNAVRKIQDTVNACEAAMQRQGEEIGQFISRMNSNGGAE